MTAVTMSADPRSAAAYRLVRVPAPAASTPTLDPSQQAVVDAVAEPGHGPLAVLAGPGTGKTTTLVEAVAGRVAAGSDPERILALTFSRRAAAELRDRIAARLGRAVATQSAWTFHAFAYAICTDTRAPEDLGRPLGLLSGPEQDTVVRDLLIGDLRREGQVQWPAELEVALGTRGFADEVRALMARARALRMEPADLARAGRQTGRPDWAGAADFLSEYLDVIDALGLLDYSELVHRAVGYAESAEGRELLRARYDLVVVDEYQDTDPAQEALLQAIAGDGRDLVVVGDPDQSIYAFRGAEVRGLLEFPARFRTGAGQPARVLTLSVSRRAGPILLEASRAVARRIPVAGGALARYLREHRTLGAGPDLPVGSVEVLSYASPGAQLDAVADLLRREHLDNGTPWSDMAVLVRSGQRSVPSVRRVLGAAGVPIEVAGDELPLAREAAAAPLLLALRVAVDLAAARERVGDDPAALREALPTDVARTLLLSPLGGLDPTALRVLGRLLRDEERTGSVDVEHPLGRLPQPSDRLLRDALLWPEGLALVGAPGSRQERVAQHAVRLARLVNGAAELVRRPAGAHEVLWSLWSGTAWPRRLARASASGGPSGRSADRDLDVVVALFDVAARDAERSERRSASAFLEEVQAQQIPAGTLSERGVRGDGVRVLTAHRSKGLEWPVVVVVDVQEDSWPDLAHRGSLLQPERLGSAGPAEPPTLAERLADERRLFYVAITRARRRLVVTAVDSPEDDGVRPSRFLTELGVEVVQVRDRPERPLTLPALVAELRAVATDPSVPEPVRVAAADRLAMLAMEREGDVRLVPAADPAAWWGLDDTSDPGVPLYPDSMPVLLSGSSLARLEDCPLRWFLEHEVHAEGPRSTALGFGSVVHALAHDVGRGETPADLDRLVALVDSVWNQLAFEAPWRSALERAHARDALARFLAWHRSERGRELLGTEHSFEVEISVGGRAVRLRGSMDRVEIDDDGAVHVVDLKTSKTTPSPKQIAEHVQLGVYQLAVEAGAIPGRAESGGAELVQLKHGDRDGLPKVQPQGPLELEESGFTWIEEVVRRGVGRMVTESFPPTLNQYCKMCAFRSSCPAQDEGRQVVT
jgi:superfamily I DNA/RNA helicase/RecB family exonuclease